MPRRAATSLRIHYKSTQAQIAEEMNFSVNVVKNYLHTAEVILGADNRCHAIALGMRRGIIQ
jgi:DNA-binding CsgD family transcriptional regulator